MNLWKAQKMRADGLKPPGKDEGWFTKSFMKPFGVILKGTSFHL